MSDVCVICGDSVTSWSARYDADSTFCKKCYGKGQPEEKQNIQSVNQTNTPPEDRAISHAVDEKSLLPTIFSFIAWVSLLCCVILGMNLLPSGSHNQTQEYIPAITWIVAGVIQCSLFLAIGKALFYLEKIANKA